MSIDESFLAHERIRPYILGRDSFFIDIGVPECYKKLKNSYLTSSRAQCNKWLKLNDHVFYGSLIINATKEIKSIFQQKLIED